MKLKLERRGLSITKLVLTVLFSSFGLFSIIYVALTTNQLFSYFYCIATIIFAAFPLFFSFIFKWKMNIIFYIIFSIYGIGPLLGAVYNIYYHTSWWDDLLHFLAGAIFAVIGAQLAYSLNKNGKNSYVFAAFFGVLLSISIAVFWEFYEFTSDMLLHSDMQADTIINDIYTKINNTNGEVDVFKNITITTVNGESLEINGYLDIGLIDTMTDMFVETLGAIVFFVYVLIGKNRYPMIVKQNNIE